MGHIGAPPDPSYEARRTQRLEEYSILDTPRESQFDRFVFTAAQLFRVPIALLWVGDTERLWFKTCVGLRMPEVERTFAFCQHMHAGTDIVSVEDATVDARFANMPAVTDEPRIRFFAASPLVTPDGIQVGCLCMIDRFPKTLLARQTWQLSQLAESIVRALEARRLDQTLDTTSRTADP